MHKIAGIVRDKNVVAEYIIVDDSHRAEFIKELDILEYCNANEVEGIQCLNGSLYMEKVEEDKHSVVCLKDFVRRLPAFKLKHIELYRDGNASAGAVYDIVGNSIIIWVFTNSKESMVKAIVGNTKVMESKDESLIELVCDISDLKIVLNRIDILINERISNMKLSTRNVGLRARVQGIIKEFR